jgi:Rps23 Pro-64 3,4-dihydroxylase Tpa1-like proline 4-hydroxylase
MKNEVKVIKNFVDKNFCNYLVNYLETNLDKLRISDDRTPYPNQRYMLRFGHDDEYPDLVNNSLDVVQEIADDLRNVFAKIERTAEALFSEDKLYTTSFFLSKHVPGSHINGHVDSAEGFNEQLDYTVLLYLNTLHNSGGIGFPKLRYFVPVEAGDLVIFPSKGEQYVHEVPNISGDRYSIPLWLTKDINYKFE